jgi:hypothetical protein
MPTRDRPGLFWPLVIVGAGALLLADNLGYLPAGWWAALGQLWPVLIILLGLDMLLGRRTPVRVSAVLGLGGLLVVGALTWAAIRASQLPPGEVQTLLQPSRGAERLEVVLEFDAGELNLSALDPSDHIFEGLAQNGPGETVRQGYAVDEGVGQLTLDQSTHPLLAPFAAARRASAVWDLRLTPALPIALDVRTGAGRITLDLSGLDLETLTLRAGVGQSAVTFPLGAATARLTTGVGETTLTVPAGLAARITVQSGLANVSVPPRFSRADDVYTTPDYDPAGEFLELEVRAGLGRVTIK